MSAAVAELADAPDSSPGVRKDVWVRLPPAALGDFARWAALSTYAAEGSAGGTIGGRPRRFASSIGTSISTFQPWPKAIIAKTIRTTSTGINNTTMRPMKSGLSPLLPKMEWGAANPVVLRSNQLVAEPDPNWPVPAITVTSSSRTASAAAIGSAPRFHRHT